MRAAQRERNAEGYLEYSENYSSEQMYEKSLKLEDPNRQREYFPALTQGWSQCLVSEGGPQKLIVQSTE